MRLLKRATVLVLSLIWLVACQGSAQPPAQATAASAADAVAQAVATADSLAATVAVLQATVAGAASATPTISPTPDPFPTPVVANIYVAEQRFEGGWLFWLQPNAQIWLLSYNTDGVAVWAVYDDTFVEGEAESDPQIVPPEGRFQPVRGFGKLWRENPEIRETLGWAVEKEQGHTTRYQYHHGGSVNEEYIYLPAPGYHLVKAANNDTYRFNEADFSWQIQS